MRRKSLIINGSVFAALQSRVRGVIFGLYGCCPDYGPMARQAAPVYAQIPVDGFLAFFGLAGLADPMRWPITGGQQNGRVAMRSQNALQCLPVAVISFLFQCPQDVSE